MARVVLSDEERRVRKNERLRKWRQKNREQILEQQRKWRFANLDKYREYYRRADKKRTSEQRKQRYLAHKAWWQRNRRDQNGKSRQRFARRTEEQRLRTNATRRAWAARNPQWGRNKHLKETYGVTLEQWEALFTAQGRCCAFCKTTEPNHRYGWATDHCHKSNKVRWILCHDCNLILGRCRENMNHLRMIIAGFEAIS